MPDRFKYSEVRQKIIDDIRLDLIGPREEEEILEESPKFAYLVGMLDIQKNIETRLVDRDSNLVFFTFVAYGLDKSSTRIYRDSYR